MIPYVVGFFSKGEIKFFDAVSKLVAAIPDTFPEGRDVLRCHELARAVWDWRYNLCPKGTWPSKLEPALVDGKYGIIEHSWLRWGNCILDPYVPGELPQVQLLHVTGVIRRSYIEGPLRTDIDESVVKELVQIFANTTGLTLPFSG